MPNFIETSDRLVSKILKGKEVRRESFNPKNKDHLYSLKNYLATGNWGEIQFYAESPCTTVPETVLRKFCLHNLRNVKVQNENTAQG